MRERIDKLLQDMGQIIEDLNSTNIKSDDIEQLKTLLNYSKKDFQYSLANQINKFNINNNSSVFIDVKKFDKSETIKVGAYNYWRELTQNQYLNSLYDSKKGFIDLGLSHQSCEEYNSFVKFKTSEMLKVLNLKKGMTVKILAGGYSKIKNFTGIIENIEYGVEGINKTEEFSYKANYATLILKQPKTKRFIESIFIEDITIYGEEWDDKLREKVQRKLKQLKKELENIKKIEQDRLKEIEKKEWDLHMRDLILRR